MGLPTAKTPPTLTPERAKTLIYGPPGVGKTTFVAGLDPDHTLILATEPGTGAIEAFVQPVGSWEEFSAACAELAHGDHEFTTIGIDTVDVLADMAGAYVMRREKISHPSDLEWGKGWQMVASEFELRVAKLCNLGYGVCFTSHVRTEEIKRSTGVGSYTHHLPAMSNAARKFLTGFVDFIFYATFDGDGNRVLRTQPAEGWEAKARLPRGAQLADPLPLNPAYIRTEIEGHLTPTKKNNGRQRAAESEG